MKCPAQTRVLLCGLGLVLPNWVHGLDMGRVELPPFVVTDVPEGLPWQYARVADFEVLTLCDDDLARQFLRAQLRGCLFLPGIFQLRRSKPVEVVLWGGKDTPLAPTRKHFYFEGRYRFGPEHSRGWYIPDIMVDSDHDTLLLSANLKTVDSYETVAIHMARASLAEAIPPVPLWLREGFSGDQGVFPSDLGIQAYDRNDRIILPILSWAPPPDANGRAIYRIMPLEELFNGSPDAIREPTRYRYWSSQAGLFVRWALFGRTPSAARAGALWKFALQASEGTVEAKTFTDCFGMDYSVAVEQLESYQADALNGPEIFNVPGIHSELPELAKASFRLATEMEVARLKGNFERMEANRLRKDFPDLAAKYEATARRTLKRGLRFAPDDPQVRAVAGLLEYDTGHPRAARPHLEAAFAAKAAGTRALLALARLRLSEMRVGLPPEGKLSTEALDRVLTPLFAARERKPAVAEVYKMIGEVWAQSSVTPARGHLAVLLEGVKLFPRDIDLLWHAAELHERRGFHAEARALAAAGLKVASDLEMHARFARLLETATAQQ